MSDLISILMPARNASAFLDECIESIRAQSWTNWELIVVNDHSNDDTLSRCQNWMQKDSRIISLDNTGRGIIDALCDAYKVCKGQFITRMDADDLMSPEKLNLLHHALIQHGRGHVTTGLVKYFSEQRLGAGYMAYEAWLNSLTQSAENFTEIYRECVIPSPCWMLYKEDFDLIGGFNSEVYPEDYDLCFRMKKAGLKVAPVQQIIHYWRDHGQRASRNDPNYLDNRFTALKALYFKQLDYNPSKCLILWGAGRKGKAMAKALTEEKLPFTWVTNNPKKWGHDIYGHSIQNSQLVLTNTSKSYQILLLISNPEEVKNVSQKLLELVQPHQVFRFT